MKQTAVEWLEKEFQEIFKEWGGLDTHWLKIFDQAKAMEKEQIKNAFGVGCQVESTRLIGYQDIAEQYYNETFKSE